MSKVEDLEITSSYWKFQIGARVLEVEEVSVPPFQQHLPEPINNPYPVPEHIYFPAIAPILNQILAVPHPIPESVPVQFFDQPGPYPHPFQDNLHQQSQQRPYLGDTIISPSSLPQCN